MSYKSIQLTSPSYFFITWTSLFSALMLAVAIFPKSGYGESLDCTKATTTVEKMICSNDELSRLDSLLSLRYKRTMERAQNPSHVMQDEQLWLINERDKCTDIDCIKRAYKHRLAELDIVQLRTDAVMPADWYHFQLTKGKSRPVCDAYLQRLNTADYSVPPYCDRPEVTTVPGFTSLHRVPLTAEQAHQIGERIGDFMDTGNQGSREEDAVKEARAKELGITSPISPVSAYAKLINDGLTKAWRYSPPVDIDNDGVADNVLVWQGVGVNSPWGICGVPTKPMEDDRQNQVAFILTDSNDRINVPKTEAIFGHPSGGYRLPNGQFAQGFRPIGLDIGIFEYEGLYYFDTFFDMWGDFYNRRKNDPEMENTLGVFLRKDGQTQQVCEYQMTKSNNRE